MAWKNMEARLAYKRAWNKVNKEKIAADNKARYEANKEKILARQQVYRKANWEKHTAYQRAWYEANKEEISTRQKVYCEANKEKIRARDKVYHEANKERRSNDNKTWYEANKERISTYKDAWRKANLDRCSAYVSRRKALKLRLIPKQLKNCPIEKQRVIDIFKLCKLISKATGVQHHVDHMWPLSDKGPEWSGNMQIITARENLTKNARVDPELKRNIKQSLKELENVFQ